MSIEAKVLNKMLMNEIKKYMKIFISLDQMESIFRNVKSSQHSKINNFNALYEKTNNQLSICRKSIGKKIQHCFMIKTLNKYRIERNFLNIMKYICKIIHN